MHWCIDKQSEWQHGNEVATGSIRLSFFRLTSATVVLLFIVNACCVHFYDLMICMYMTARQDATIVMPGNRHDVDFNSNDKC